MTGAGPPLGQSAPPLEKVMDPPLKRSGKSGKADYQKKINDKI